MTDTLNDRIAKFREDWSEVVRASTMGYEAGKLLADCQKRIEDLEGPAPDGLMKCPFCGENDFDLEGLDMHLYKYCEKYGGIHAQADRIQKLEAELQAAKDEIKRFKSLESRLYRAEALLLALSGCMPDRVYVTDSIWSDSEPEEGDFVLVDFAEYFREKDLSPSRPSSS